MLGESMSAYKVKVPLEPERREARELFRARERRIHGQRARRQSILPCIGAHRPKIARAEECRDVVLPIRHELHAKACEARMTPHQLRVDAGFVEFEHRGVVDDFARLTVDDLVEAHRLGEGSAGMKELQAKRQSQVGPESVIRAKTQ
jgi:hypothetical protein